MKIYSNIPKLTGTGEWRKFENAALNRKPNIFTPKISNAEAWPLKTKLINVIIIPIEITLRKLANNASIGWVRNKVNGVREVAEW